MVFDEVTHSCVIGAFSKMESQARPWTDLEAFSFTARNKYEFGPAYRHAAVLM